MNQILKQLKEQELKTGLRIVDIPYDYGLCAVLSEDNKEQFRGDRIRCQLFINKFEKFMDECSSVECSEAALGEAQRIDS